MNQRNQILIIYLTMPMSDFYVSKMLRKTKNPSLEPFKPGGTMDLGNINIFNQKIGLELSKLVIKGISNVQIQKVNGQPKINIDGDKVTFYAVRPNTESPPPKSVPTDLVVTTQLKLVARGLPSPPVPITITVKNGTLIGEFNSAGDVTNPDSVTVKFTSLTVKAAANTNNIKIDLSQLNSMFRKQVQAYVDQPSTLKDMLSRVNQELKSPAVLDAVSKAATQAAGSSLKKMPV